MKKPIPINFETAVEPELLRVLTRMEDLEKDSYSIASSIEMKDLGWHTNISELKRSTAFLKEEGKGLKERIRKIKEVFIDTVYEFRENADIEDFAKLKQMVDDWHVEDFISRSEFTRKIEEAAAEKNALRKF
jgi:hypothetical protein